MTVELITGTPGAGKTTFAVATRLVEESKRSIPLDNEACAKLGVDLGTIVQRRMVVAGIRGLVLEHERLPHILTRDATSAADVERYNAFEKEEDPSTGKMIDSDRPIYQRLPGEPARADVLPIMQNWWTWCMPGDLIVIDEAQFVMPRGTLGRKPPLWLQLMEIHRHYGVDFIFITQHPQLIDTTVRSLVGLHRHVRSVMGSGVCMVYVWDHASNPERYNLANKTTFIRRKRYYKLFNSTVAVVKPPTSGRWGLVAAPVLALIALLGMGNKIHGWLNPAVAKPAGSSAPGAPASSPEAALAALRSTTRTVEVRGCWSQGDRCSCMDGEGRSVNLHVQACRTAASSFDGAVKWAPQTKIQARYGEGQPGQAQPATRPASAPGQPLPALGGKS